MARDGHKSFSVAHDDMSTLPDHPESGFFKSPYRVEVVNTWEFRHRLCHNFYFVRFLITAHLFCRS